MSAAIRAKIIEAATAIAPPNWSRDPFTCVYADQGRVGRLEEITRRDRYFDLAGGADEADERLTCKCGSVRRWKSATKLRLKYIPAGDPTDGERLERNIRADGRAILAGLVAAKAGYGAKSFRAGPGFSITAIEERDGKRVVYLEIPIAFSFEE